MDEHSNSPQKRNIWLRIFFPIRKAKTPEDKEREDMLRKEREFRAGLSWILSSVVFLTILVVIIISAIIIFLTGNHVPGLAGAKNPGIFYLVTAIFSILVGTGASFLIGVPILRPINRLINGMKHLAEGDYKVRVPEDTFSGRFPLYSDVFESFNRLARELEGTEMLRSDFINNFSHEFKTPIVSITGFASLLRQGDLSEEEKGEYLAIIETEARRLSDMSNNVLTMSRIEKQTILTDVTEFNLSEQLRSTILMLESKWDKKELDLDLIFEEHMVKGNEQLLRQVWLNLLDNAIKFTPEGGTVKVRVHNWKDRIEVKITNTGSEIPEDKQRRIFRKFYQADESHQTEGNGIGLAIVKYIVELHKGSVEVESANMVTTFSVNLPA